MLVHSTSAANIRSIDLIKLQRNWHQSVRVKRDKSFDREITSRPLNIHDKKIPNTRLLRPSNIGDADADTDADQLQPKQRPTVKRPANAPPPRPTVRPPPPPTDNRKSDANAVIDSSSKRIPFLIRCRNDCVFLVESRSTPPRRPPPPSTKSVQAAVDRRRTQNVTVKLSIKGILVLRITATKHHIIGDRDRGRFQLVLTDPKPSHDIYWSHHTAKHYW